METRQSSFPLRVTLIRYTLLYIALISLPAVVLTFLSSCENEIPYEPEKRESLLVMNALLSTGEADNRVTLYLSEGYDIAKVSEAALTLYVNGRIAETQQSAESEFCLTTLLQPGDHIRLEAEAENGAYHVASEVTAPQPVGTMRVDTCTTYLRSYSGLMPHRQYNISFTDRPDEKNFYRLEILNDLRYRCEWQEYLMDEEGNLIPAQGALGWECVTKDTLITDRRTELINREDVILTDGQPSNFDDEENDLFPVIRNRNNIFTDSRFANASATLKVYTPLYNDCYFDLGYRYSRIFRAHTVTVRLLNLSEEEYRYLKALNCLQDENYDNTLMEPVVLPGNVEGGLGFVGIAAETKVVMEFPETVFRGEFLNK